VTVVADPPAELELLLPPDGVLPLPAEVLPDEELVVPVPVLGGTASVPLPASEVW
jgi:hypothetical protein